MTTEQNKATDLIELITWAIDRILTDQYELTRGDDGKPEVLELGNSLGPGRALTLEVRERLVEELLSKFASPEALDAFQAMRQNRTPEKLTALLEKSFKGAEASLALAELKDAPWEDILIYIDDHFFRGPHVVRRIGALISKEREGFSSPSGRNVEAVFEHRLPGELAFFAARKYAAELRQEFPELVKRATAPEFRLLAASKNVPESMKRYLIEASRCYLYGQFLACLVVCRSTIEEAVKQRLIEIGKESQVKQDNRLVKLLRLALKENLLDARRHKMADDIRKRATDAVHGKKLPDEKECIECFHQTRGVLEYLYGQLQ